MCDVAGWRHFPAVETLMLSLCGLENVVIHILNYAGIWVFPLKCKLFKTISEVTHLGLLVLGLHKSVFGQKYTLMHVSKPTLCLLELFFLIYTWIHFRTVLELYSAYVDVCQGLCCEVKHALFDRVLMHLIWAIIKSSFRLSQIRIGHFGL